MADEALAVTQRDADGRSTCPHEDAVKWNPYNKVVQCHRCGQQFTPVPLPVDEAATLDEAEWAALLERARLRALLPLAPTLTTITRAEWAAFQERIRRPELGGDGQ